MVELSRLSVALLIVLFWFACGVGSLSHVHVLRDIRASCASHYQAFISKPRCPQGDGVFLFVASFHVLLERGHAISRRERWFCRLAFDIQVQALPIRFFSFIYSNLKLSLL